MSTAKEIEEIIGTSSRTIDMWSRSRDDRYLLAKLLKSYSKFDLMQRVDHILKEDGFIKKSWSEVIISIAKNPSAIGIIDSDKKFYIRDACDVNADDLFALPNFKSLYSHKPKLLLPIHMRPSLVIEIVEELFKEGDKPLKKILVVEFPSLLPSKNNLINMYNKHARNLNNIILEHDIEGDKYIYFVELILITKSKKPKFLLEDDELAKKIKIFDFDEVAKKLYGQEVIVI